MPSTGMLRHRFGRLPVDPDVDLSARRSLPTPVAAALVAAGGVAGSLARAGIAELKPHQAGTWPWSTLTVNLVGAAGLAVLLALLVERWPRARTLRPLLGTGVMGGFTTFSTFAVDAGDLGRAGRPGLAVGYVAVTLGGGALVSVLALVTTRAAVRRRDGDGWQRRVEAHLAARDLGVR